MKAKYLIYGVLAYWAWVILKSTPPGGWHAYNSTTVSTPISTPNPTKLPDELSAAA